jgi:hypothetical protein
MRAHGSAACTGDASRGVCSKDNGTLRVDAIMHNGPAYFNGTIKVTAESHRSQALQRWPAEGVAVLRSP